jgi:hypothetical protein
MLTLAGLASRFVLPLSYTARVMYPGRASSVYRAPHLLATINARIEETCVGMAYCRPLSRADMVALLTLLRHLLKIGTPPP